MGIGTAQSAETQLIRQSLRSFFLGLHAPVFLSVSPQLCQAYWPPNKMKHRNTVILLFRPKTIENFPPSATERDLRARNAADRITRFAEDLLASGTINSGLIHLYDCVVSFITVKPHI